MKIKPIMLIAVLIVCVFGFYALLIRKRSYATSFPKVVRELVLRNLPPYRKDCTFHSCFLVTKCQSFSDNRISVGIHPWKTLSREQSTLLRSIKESDQYTEEHTESCLSVLPLQVKGNYLFSVDNKIKIRNDTEIENNYIIFDFASQLRQKEALPIGSAIIAGAAMPEEAYRHTYDIAIPMFNPLTAHLHLKYETRKRLFVMTQVTIPINFRNALDKASAGREDVLVLRNCKKSRSFFKRCSANEKYDYPQILKSAKFCGITSTEFAVEQTTLYDAMKAGCIPVFLGKNNVLPFSEVLDWKRCSIRVLDHQVANVVSVLEVFSASEIAYMRRHVRHFFQSYMSSIRKIAATTIRIVNDRTVPHAAWTPAEWNDPLSVRRQTPPSPLFYPLAAPMERGFTAVLLTYNRFPQLRRLLIRLAETPSLRRFVVVWNNPDTAPPPISEWPPLGKSVTIIRSLRNSLNNRFTPFEEIDTEAVLSMDDDIDMLTPDELEFAFRVWSQHTDRLVGIPSRLHWQDNVTGAWRYDSEWKSELSIVLTGAAFFHKYYGYLYRTRMPVDVTKYVDDKMMCEDIAMNFLIAHLSGKSPLKVTPRKKFRCPTCVNSSSSLRTVKRLHERSLCVANFARHFDTRVPLRTIDFRLDPLLMGVPGEHLVDAYRNVGRL